MTTEVGLQKDGEIAVITVDNPPVNALKQVVRAGLLSTLTGGLSTVMTAISPSFCKPTSVVTGSHPPACPCPAPFEI